MGWIYPRTFFTSYRFWRAIWIRDLSLTYDVFVFSYYQSSRLTWRDYNPCPIPIFYQNFSFGQQFEEIRTGFWVSKPILKKCTFPDSWTKVVLFPDPVYFHVFVYLETYRWKKLEFRYNTGKMVETFKFSKFSQQESGFPLKLNPWKRPDDTVKAPFTKMWWVFPM